MIGYTIRLGRPEDAETLVALVRELAGYEGLAEFVHATPESFRTHLLGSGATGGALLAEIDGAAVGFAIYFPTFSSFRGEIGFYLEDIFVREPYRDQGIGRALLASVAAIGAVRGIGRLEWSVLDWNEPAIGFYRALGALPLDDWTVFRIDGDDLARLAAQAPPLTRETPDA